MSSKIILVYSLLFVLSSFPLDTGAETSDDTVVHITREPYNDLPVWQRWDGDSSHTSQSRYSISSQPDNVQWKFFVEDGLYHTPVISDKGTIYFYADEGRYKNYLYALKQDRTIQWRVNCFLDEGKTPYLGPDGTIYVPATENITRAYNEDGNLMGEYDFSDETPVISSSRMFVAGKLASEIKAWNNEGELIWTFSNDSMTIIDVAISPNEAIYATAIGRDNNERGFLLSLNMAGQLKWIHEYQGRIVTPPATGPSGNACFLTSNGTVYYSYPNGTLDWHYYTGNLSGKPHSPSSLSLAYQMTPSIGNDGDVYVSSIDGVLYSLGPDGVMKWTFNSGNGVSKATLDADGDILVKSGGSLYLLNADGLLIHNISVISSRFLSNPVIGADGTIYITTYGLCERGGAGLVALGHSADLPPDRPWGVLTYDNYDSIEIRWYYPCDSTDDLNLEYNIYRSTDDINFTLLDTVNASQWRYFDESVRRITQYFYYITAVNEFGESAPSDKVNETTRDFSDDDEADDNFLDMTIEDWYAILIIVTILVIFFRIITWKGPREKK